MRKLMVVNFIIAFFASSLAMALPLYLLQKGVDVQDIGLIVCVTPLAFLILRAIASVAAEVLGTRPFFLANSASQALASLTFMFASTPLGFALGELLNGSAQSFFWAVNRTKVIEREASKDVSLAKLLAIRMLASTIGIGVAGMVISYSFESFFQMLALGGIASFIISLFFWKGKGPQEKIDPSNMLDFNGKSRLFKETSFSIFFFAAAFAIFFSFLLPVYLRSEFGMPYESIGALVMFFYLSMAVGSYSAIELGLDERALLFFQDITIPLLLLLPLSHSYLFPLLMLVGFGFGVCYAMQEKMVVLATQGSRYLSADVALIFSPSAFGEFLVLALSGFILAFLGSTALFAVSAALVALFVYYSRDALKQAS